MLEGLYSNKDEGKNYLFAEMKLPGEAWLEFKILDDELIQTAHSDQKDY